MFITNATESAVRALLYLASQPRGQVIRKRDICRTQAITHAFLLKIFQPLLKAGIIGSRRGINGGFYLRRQARRISMLDIIETIEGPLYLNKCLIRDGFCRRDKTCPVHPVWHRARKRLESTLAEQNLAMLAAKNGRRQKK